MGYEPHDDWHEHVIDDFVEFIEEMGFEFDTVSVKLYGGGMRRKPVVHFSGFWSQGDGACFAGHVVDFAKWAAAVGYSANDIRRIKRLDDRGMISLKASCGNRYPNQLTEVDAPRTEKRHKTINRMIADLERTWSDWCADQSSKLYRDLELEYEYQTAWGELQTARQRMAEARESVLEHIETIRGYRDAAMANPSQYESAMTDLDSAWSDYREATDKAFEAADCARRHGISWGDCSP